MITEETGVYNPQAYFFEDQLETNVPEFNLY